MDDALDAQHALVAALPGLGLGQVSGFQRDGLHLSHRDQDLLRGEELGAVLGAREDSGRSRRGWDIHGSRHVSAHGELADAPSTPSARRAGNSWCGHAAAGSVQKYRTPRHSPPAGERC